MLDMSQLRLRDATQAWFASWDIVMQDDWLREKLDRSTRLRNHLDYLHAYAEHIFTADPGIVVDLGCGPGETLEICRAMGHTAIGVDTASGSGGMGDAYVAASRLMWQRQQLDVRDCGLKEFLATASVPSRSCVLMNSRGSLEQMLADHMTGEPHHVHHDCMKLAWRMTDALEGWIEGLLRFAARTIREDGTFVIHANGAANGEEMGHLLDETASRVRLRTIRREENLHIWRI